MSPEQTLNHFLRNSSESSDQYFDREDCFLHGITRTLFQHETLTDPDTVNRDSYKKWFQKYQTTFDATNLFHFYALQHEKELNEFRNQLEKAYNKLSKRIFLPPL